MKTVIRQGVFETNSSSTHTICINKDFDCTNLDTNLKFGIGEFGWGWDEHYDIYTKAAYLHEAIISSSNDKAEYEDFKNKITEALNTLGVKTVWNNVDWDEDDYPEYYSHGYIDHGYELRPWVELLLTDTSLLYGFLFNSTSYIETGNDNSYSPLESIDENKFDYVYEKGN